MPSPQDYPQLCSSLTHTVRQLGIQGWCPATGGNFSVRVDDALRLITCSGRDKRHLEQSDLMLCDSDGVALDADSKPSDETPLHMALYSLEPSIAAVLHTHSVTATVLSRKTAEQNLLLQGYEMQKALSCCTSHDDTLRIRIFDNTQDIPALAIELKDAWHAGELQAPGFLVRGHGLYAWGNSLVQAQRHVEGFEFLFNCLWQERLLKAN